MSLVNLIENHDDLFNSQPRNNIHMGGFVSTARRINCTRIYRLIWLVMIILVLLISLNLFRLLIIDRQHIFNESTTEVYYLNNYEKYLDFLAWGSSGIDHLKHNISEPRIQKLGSVQKMSSSVSSPQPQNILLPHSHRKVVLSNDEYINKYAEQEEDEDNSEQISGWNNLCSFPILLDFILMEQDEIYCEASDVNSYLQGCALGFYQPIKTSNFQRTNEYHEDDDAKYENFPKVCPNGFFCPLNLVCTISCIPGSQCFQSSFKTINKEDDEEEEEGEECVYPKTMNKDGLGLLLPTSPFSLPYEMTNNTDNKASTMLTCPGSGNMFLCQGGYYCPTPVTYELCPDHHYCPIGSIYPKSCPILGTCHGIGNEFPQYRRIIYSFCLFLLFIFMMSLKIFRLVRSIFRKKRIEQYNLRLLTPQLTNEEVEVDEEEYIVMYGSDHSVSLSMMNRPLTCHSEISHTNLSMDEPSLNQEDQSSSSNIHSIDTRLDLQFDHLGLRLRDQNQVVLQAVCGQCKSGRITVIMGPSGAGKTTLMNVLADRAHYGILTGCLKINGQADTIRSYQHLVGFVPQDDIMHRDLTIQENFLFYANLRLPKKTNSKHRIEIMKDIMKMLELDNDAHNIIGDFENRGLSGGQCKRVNIGIELVANPSLLFLDEPTSGLDSSTSYAILSALKVLSQEKQCNIIAVLHQPSYQLYEMFDDVIFLAKGGCSVYVGEARHAMTYFNHIGFQCPHFMNPADFFLDVIAGKCKYHEEGKELHKDDLIRMWKEYANNQPQRVAQHEEEEEEEEKSFFEHEDNTEELKPLSKESLLAVEPVGFGVSFLHFASRAFTQQMRASTQLLADLFLEFFAGSLVGCLYLHVQFQDITKFITFAALALGLTISIASLRVFGDERLVFWRESGMQLNIIFLSFLLYFAISTYVLDHITLLSSFAYFMAKNVMELPRLALLSFFFVMSFYPLVAPNMEWYYYYGFILSGAFACSGIAYFASIALSLLKAQLFIVIYVLVAVMFSGTATRLSDLSENGLFLSLTYLSFARWLCEVCYLQHIYNLSIAWRMPPAYYLKGSPDSALYGIFMLQYTPTTYVMILDLILLCSLGVIFRSFAFISLLLCHREKRGLPTLSQMISSFWIPKKIKILK